MGKRGPKPKPTALKKLLGNPGKRTLNDHEPAAPAASPDPPMILRSVARPFWDKLAPTLITMKVLSEVDVMALARYCNLLHRYHVLEEFLMSRGAAGTTIAQKDAKGKVIGAKEIPQAWEYRQAHGALLQYEREFGMTPSSRTRLHIDSVVMPAAIAAATAAVAATKPEPRDYFAGGGPAAPRPAKA